MAAFVHPPFVYNILVVGWLRGAVDFKAARTKKCYKTATTCSPVHAPEAKDLLDITKD
jgi:hypothetical protein